MSTPYLKFFKKILRHHFTALQCNASPCKSVSAICHLCNLHKRTCVDTGKFVHRWFAQNFARFFVQYVHPANTARQDRSRADADALVGSHPWHPLPMIVHTYTIHSVCLIIINVLCCLFFCLFVVSLSLLCWLAGFGLPSPLLACLAQPLSMRFL